MSLRAVGEGHISSIEFRTGVIDGAGDGDLRSARAAAWSPASARRRPATTSRRFAPSSSSSARATTSPGPCSIRCPERVHARRARAVAGALERDGPPHAISLRDGQDHSRARLVELRHDVPCRLGALRAGDLPRRPARDPRHGGRPLRPLHRRRRRGDVLRDLHGVRRLRDHAAADPDRRLRSLPHLDAQRPGRAEQGNGAVPASDRRKVRDAVAPRSREPPPGDLDGRPALGRRHGVASAEPSVGAAADRQLRLAPRDGGGLAGRSPTASGRCGATCSARCCWTSTIPGA